MMVKPRPFECSVCRALFKTKPDLAVHLNKTSPSCKTTPKKREEASKPENYLPKIRVDSEKRTDSDLLLAMETRMERKYKQEKMKSGLESSILSAIADGDEELVSAYSRMSLDPVARAGRIDEKIVNSVCSKANMNMERIARLISQARHIGICFLLDTTGSMCSYINGVKEQIVEIVARLEASGCGIEGLAFVGYKDWCDGINHFEILPFTKSISEFKSFVATICAKGGGDFPEDVLGGLSRAISLNWPLNSGTRIIFHLGDAPPHGKTIFHDGRHRDDYENGHPHDPPLEELFRDMHRKKLMYYFGRINGDCDRMIATFERYYGGKIETLDSAEVCNILRSVTESVMRSVSVTQRSDFPTTVDKESLPFSIEKKEPNWAQLLRLDGTILTLELPTSVEEITSFAKLQDKIKKCRLQIAPNPFAKGSVRLAYFGKIYYSSSKDSNSSASEIVDDAVFKEIISLPKVADLDRWRYMTDLEAQTVAAKLAIEFNGRLFRTQQNPNIKTKFLMTKLVRVFKKEDVAPRYLAYEQRFRGNPNMVKYTNNVDFVHDAESLDENGRKKLEIALAFSHFSHDITDGYLLVCDLQGVSYVDAKGKEILLLTDPAIHCSKHIRFGKTNLSSIGINKFFKKHVCNKYCLALGLKMPSG
ncbi:Uncharacterized protein APZ42_023761 [Daphnia magna]|uniref:Alpha-type protein kinase domain-containing protein n=1 Tax=Daphnia magna TaxID=35525 RepID=A0A164U412_9CRUS|nr:Uncharacterized protein APZ42_023761 [Daphnia magna]